MDQRIRCSTPTQNHVLVYRDMFYIMLTGFSFCGVGDLHTFVASSTSDWISEWVTVADLQGKTADDLHARSRVSARINFGEGHSQVNSSDRHALHRGWGN